MSPPCIEEAFLLEDCAGAALPSEEAVLKELLPKIVQCMPTRLMQAAWHRTIWLPPQAETSWNAVQVLPFILRRTKEAVLTELPPKIVQDVLCTPCFTHTPSHAISSGACS